MNFRYDINGLRAIAVIAVVLFHFNPAWVPGGFAGVDVFFVISGFLMTGIIFRGLENDNFNLFKFYVARANRIIPALAFLCLVLLIFGWFYLTPLDYRALGKHVASSMGFLSNVIYWRESGYFDAASHEKWLLHTWSLSVEWQFYILYPIVLVALKKFLSLENLKRLIVIGTVLSFCLSVIATMKWPNAAYYLLPTRAWEMMMGGVAFLYPWSLYEGRKKIVEFTGLALILGSYAFVSSEIPWPGHFALLPVLGAYLIIVSNQQSSFLTNNTLFQYLGKWSYSIYLWHWPVVVYGYYFDDQGWVLYGLPLSLFMGFVSFKFIEGTKFKSFSNWFDLLRIKPVYMVVVISFLGGGVFLSQGFYHRLDAPKGFDKVAFYGDSLNDGCLLSKSGSDGAGCKKEREIKLAGTLLLGDSHAGAISHVLKSKLKAQGETVVNLSSPGCIPFLGIKRHTVKAREDCDKYNQYVYNAIDNSEYKNIIVYARLPLYLYGGNNKGDVLEPYVYFSEDKDKNEISYFDAMSSSLCKLSEKHNVNVVMPTPEIGFNAGKYVQNAYLFQLDIEEVSYDYVHKRVSILNGFLFDIRDRCGINLVNVYDDLCPNGKCLLVNEKGLSIYHDDNHVTEVGAEIIVDKLLEYGKGITKSDLINKEKNSTI
jgi:peptidoglycan/LPS O-acetylase OafA/YrhL